MQYVRVTRLSLLGSSESQSQLEVTSSRSPTLSIVTRRVRRQISSNPRNARLGCNRCSTLLPVRLSGVRSVLSISVIDRLWMYAIPSCSHKGSTNDAHALTTSLNLLVLVHANFRVKPGNTVGEARHGLVSNLDLGGG